jgi:hypothetical protein
LKFTTPNAQTTTGNTANTTEGITSKDSGTIESDPNSNNIKKSFVEEGKNGDD